MFGSAEQRGIQEPKFRAIDDIPQSIVNMTVAAVDTYYQKDIETFMVLDRLHHTYGARNHRTRSVDFFNANKTIGVGESSKGASYICFINADDNRPYTAKAIGQPSGIRMFPNNWGRAVAFPPISRNGPTLNRDWGLLRWCVLRGIAQICDERPLGIQRDM